MRNRDRETRTKWDDRSTLFPDGLRLKAPVRSQHQDVCRAHACRETTGMTTDHYTRSPDRSEKKKGSKATATTRQRQRDREETEKRQRRDREETEKRQRRDREETEKRQRRDREETEKRQRRDREETEKRQRRDREETEKRQRRDREETEKRQRRDREETEKRQRRDREETERQKKKERCGRPSTISLSSALHVFQVTTEKKRKVRSTLRNFCQLGPALARGSDSYQKKKRKVRSTLHNFWKLGLAPARSSLFFFRLALRKHRKKKQKKKNEKKMNLHRSRVPAYTHNLMTAFDISDELRHLSQKNWTDLGACFDYTHISQT